ncbi:MAG: PhzF family phenazine biosynthesis protein [Gemmatimonadota bacterium]
MSDQGGHDPEEGPDGTPSLPIYTVDAFSREPFGGNPAAVCLLDSPRDAVMLQAVAREMNLSETAFVERPDPDSGLRRLRWFTPQAEVPLCGHATLATAHVLFQRDASSPLRFSTLSGVLEVWHEPDGRLCMDFPMDVPVPAAPSPELLDALGLEAPPVESARGSMSWVIRLADPDQVLAARPDYRLLRDMDPGDGIVGLSLTAERPQGGIHSRFFAPWVGVDEDPVTGMAHTALAPFWAERLGQAEIHARQGLNRQGELILRVHPPRVHLLGEAVTVVRGRIRIPESVPG